MHKQKYMYVYEIEYLSGTFYTYYLWEMVKRISVYYM